MNKSAAAVALTTATIAVAVLNGGAASADSGSGSSGGTASAGTVSGTWPADLPLPTSPGTVVEQTDSTAVVRSTDTVGVVMDKLDELYVTQKGCTLQLAVNKPKDFLCFNPDTRKVDEILFTFAALDRTVFDPSLSQSNAFYFRG